MAEFGVVVEKKRCTACQRLKPLESFYPYKRMKAGRLNKCKQCFLAERSTTPKKKARAVGGRNPSGKSGIRPAADRPWRERAACKNQPGDWVEVPRLGVQKQREARLRELSFCGVCPVTIECLEHAEPYGIWGGTLPKERRS